jgi:four helix bundle protein
MFDFEKLDLFQIVKKQNLKVLSVLKTNHEIDPYLMDQLKKASLSILFNLAEGAGHMTDQDKKHYFTIARGSVYESVAILSLLNDLQVISKADFAELYEGYESCSKMLLAMYRSYSK